MGAVLSLQIPMRRSELFSAKNLQNFLILAKTFEKRSKPVRFARGGRTIAVDCYEARWPLEGIGTVQVLFRSPEFPLAINGPRMIRERHRHASPERIVIPLDVVALRPEVPVR